MSIGGSARRRRNPAIGSRSTSSSSLRSRDHAGAAITSSPRSTTAHDSASSVFITASTTAIEFVDYALERFPVPGRRDSDRQRFRVPSSFLLARARRGCGTRIHQAADASAQRQSRRSPRIDAEEFYRLLDGVVIDDSKTFNEKLREWEHFCNYARPHGALGGQTPYERLRQKTTADVIIRVSHTVMRGSPGNRTLNLRIKSAT